MTNDLLPNSEENANEYITYDQWLLLIVTIAKPVADDAAYRILDIFGLKRPDKWPHHNNPSK